MMEKVLSLTPFQIRRLDEALKKSWTGDETIDYLLRISLGIYDAWVPKAAPDSVVITQMETFPAGRTLFLLVVAGRGILKVGKDVAADLRVIAKANNCKFIIGDGFPEGWKRYGPSVGFRAVATTYLMEVDDVQ